MRNEFEQLNGFPRQAVTLANWRLRPYNSWAFRNVAELVPSVRISVAAPRSLAALAADPGTLDAAVRGDGGESLADFFLRSRTDSFLLAREGRLVAEWHAPYVDRDDPHLLFSISKSVTAILTGILEDRGLVDPATRIGDIFAQANHGAYGDATIRNLLDMRVSLDFEESYLSDGDYARYRRAMLWNPPAPDQEDPGLFALLCGLPKGRAEHGGDHVYSSPNTDMLGLVLEGVTGRRFSRLASDLLWQPMGASADAMMTVDRFGAPRTAGGISCRPHDLLSLGQLLLDDGKANGRQIVPLSWIEDMKTNGDPEAWARGSQSDLLADGRYRSCWYQVGGGSRAFMAIGIHGQFLYVDPASRTVIVKLASQDEPQEPNLDDENLKLFARLASNP